MKILIDAMGGDNAPLEVIKGVCLAKAEDPELSFVLIGRGDEIRAALAECGADCEEYEIVEAEQVITMEDSPMSALREKKNSSMSVGLRKLAEGEGDAFVSGGNTGALFAGAVLIVRAVKGVRRPAIATLMPLEFPVLLLDAGANISVTPEYLEKFGVMGSIYMEKVFGVERPRVGLLNNGVESCKGTAVQVEAYGLLEAEEYINFVGNVEANRVTQNACDVLVADGFSGNILLKSMEGMGSVLIQSLNELCDESALCAEACERLRTLRHIFDSREHGGAPILGLKKPVIKAHGGSDAKAFKNAIREAVTYAKANVASVIAETVAASAAPKGE